MEGLEATSCQSPNASESLPKAAESKALYRKRRLLTLGVIAFGGACLGLALLFLAPSWKPQELIQLLKQTDPGLFFGCMAMLPAIGFPLSAFNIAAGPAFGSSLGLPLVITLAFAAITVNVAINYVLARYALRPIALAAARWLGYSLPAIPAHRHLAAAFIVRITPGPPFFVQSYLLGLANVHFLPYMVASCLIPWLYTTLVIVGGDAAMHGRMRTVLLCAALLGVISIGLKLLRKRGKGLPQND